MALDFVFFPSDLDGEHGRGPARRSGDVVLVASPDGSIGSTYGLAEQHARLVGAYDEVRVVARPRHELEDNGRDHFGLLIATRRQVEARPFDVLHAAGN